jgi:hypothetical protein
MLRPFSLCPQRFPITPISKCFKKSFSHIAPFFLISEILQVGIKRLFDKVAKSSPVNK